MHRARPRGTCMPRAATLRSPRHRQPTTRTRRRRRTHRTVRTGRHTCVLRALHALLTLPTVRIRAPSSLASNSLRRYSVPTLWPHRLAVAVTMATTRPRNAATCPHTRPCTPTTRRRIWGGTLRGTDSGVGEWRARRASERRNQPPSPTPLVYIAKRRLVRYTTLTYLLPTFSLSYRYSPITPASCALDALSAGFCVHYGVCYRLGESWVSFDFYYSVFSVFCEVSRPGHRQRRRRRHPYIYDNYDGPPLPAARPSAAPVVCVYYNYEV